MGCLGSGGDTEGRLFGKSPWVNVDYTLDVLLEQTSDWEQFQRNTHALTG